MEIKRVDPLDDAAVAAWHGAWAAGAAAGRENPPIWTLPEVIAQLRNDDPDRSHAIEAFTAVEAGTVVGAGRLEYPLKDNPKLAEFEIDVPPEHRNRGVGTELYYAVADRAAELGRDSFATIVHQPIGAPKVPGVDFAIQRGFTRRNVYLHRSLSLPVAAETLAALAAEVQPYLGGYRIESWQGPCPDHYVEQYAHLRSLILIDSPTGDMDLEPEVWDVARLRAEEALCERQGRTMLTSVAVAPDGSLAGHTQIAVPGHEPGRAYQWDTLVLAKHRGHRLGLALKLTNLRILGERFGDRTNVATWNAEQNGPMNAVNAKLGFTAKERSEEWQRDPR